MIGSWQESGGCPGTSLQMLRQHQLCHLYRGAGFLWWDPQPSHMGGLDVECGYVQEKKKDILDFNDMIKEKVPTEVLGLRLMHQYLSLLDQTT